MIQIRVGSAVTVLNAIVTGKGATLGTSPVHRLVLDEADTLTLSSGDDRIGTELLRSCIEQFSEKTDTAIDNIKISVDAKYPPAKGMKTSSAISCGVIDLLDKRYSTGLTQSEIINLSADASINAGVSVTGAIDDAYGSYLGGFHVTDNTTRQLIKRHRLDLSKDVIFLIPEKETPKSTLDLDFDMLDSYVMDQAFQSASEGDWRDAIAKNTRIYGQYLLDDWDIVNDIEDLIDGVVGLNGAGPSLFVICPPASTQSNATLLSDEFPQYETLISQLRSYP